MSTDMEVVIDFQFFRWRHNEIVVNEISMAAKTVTDSFCFNSPYRMTSHRSEEKGLNWGDGHITYDDLYTVVSEAVAGITHLYVYGVTKFCFLSEILGRPILNLQDFNCPQPTTFNHKCWCSLSCHKFPNVNCATKTAHFLYKLFLYHFQTKCYVKCREDMISHTAKFLSTV